MARFAIDPQTTFTLPLKVAEQLVAYARVNGDDPADALADIVALHFDELDGEGAEHEPYVVPVDDDLFADQVADTVQP